MLTSFQTASNLDDLKVNVEKGFLIGGISAGACFAAVASHLYRDEGISPPLTGCFLSIPSTVSVRIISKLFSNFI